MERPPRLSVAGTRNNGVIMIANGANTVMINTGGKNTSGCGMIATNGIKTMAIATFPDSE
jgi:hypothetical protein